MMLNFNFNTLVLKYWSEGIYIKCKGNGVIKIEVD